MKWPDDEPIDFDAQTRNPPKPLFGDLNIFVDASCPKGVLWFRGYTILRLDQRTHDAHLGAVGGE